MKEKFKVPKLRFKEFSGELNKYKLLDIADKINEKNRDEKVRFVLSNSAIQGIVSQTDYFERDIVTQSNLGGYYVVDKDDFVYNPRISVYAPVGPIKRNKLNKGIMSPLYTVFRIKNTNLNYIEHYFSTDKWHDYLKSIANFGARHDRMNITGDGFFNMPLNLPSLPEQQKIADFLSIVDEKIEKLTKKKELLEQYKKGVMQKIFSQEIRFKNDDGNDFPEWEEKEFRNFATFFSGGTPLTSKKEYYVGSIPFIKSGEINKNETEQFINEDALNNSSAKKVEKGDLLVALYGATSGEVGISRLDGAINQAILCIRSKEINYFLYNYFKLNKEIIIKTYLQGGQGNLSADIIKSLKINLPSLPEQQKIADFLSALDKKIDIASQELAGVQEFKKGLLQQMFV